MKLLYRVFLSICLMQTVFDFDCGQKFLPSAFAEISSWKIETSPEVDAVIDKKNIRIVDNAPAMETFIWQPVVETMTWRQTNGPNGGNISALVMNPQGHIFAATYRSGVFRSIDNGKTWSHLGLGGQYIHDLAIDLKGNIFAGFSGGIYKSSDNGDTWKRVFSNGIIHFYHIKNAIVAQNTSEGETFYQSSDNGEIWNRSHSFDIEGSMMAALTTDSEGSLFMGTSRYFYWDSENTGGVYRSRDNGKTWTLTST